MIADARPPANHLDHLPRWCRCDNGTPKKAFPTRQEARDYGRYVWGDVRRFWQYQCRACGWYHNSTRKAA